MRLIHDKTGVIRDVSDFAERKKLLAVGWKEVAPVRVGSNFKIAAARRFKDAEMAQFARSLSITLEGEHLSKVRVLEDYAELLEGLQRKELLDAAAKIARGYTMHKALCETSLFSKDFLLFLGLGEKTNIAPVLERLASFYEAKVAMSGKLGPALYYFVFMISACYFAFVGIYAIAIPQVKAAMSDAGSVGVVQVIFQVSDLFAATWWLWIIAYAGICVALAIESSRNIALNLLASRWKLLGRYMHAQKVYRFYSGVALLVDTGTLMQNTLLPLGETFGGTWQRQFKKAHELCSSGAKFSSSLQTTQLGRRATGLMAVAEESGQVERLLNHFSRMYGNESSSMSTELSTKLSLVMTIIMLAFVGLIAFSFLVPMGAFVAAQANRL